MNFLNKAAVFCLAAMLIFSLIPVCAFAEDADSSNEPAMQINEAGEENKEPAAEPEEKTTDSQTTSDDPAQNLESSNREAQHSRGKRSIEEPSEQENQKSAEPAIQEAPAPVVLISRTDMDQPLDAGKETTLTISFQNFSDRPLSGAVATFETSEELTLLGGASSFAVADIGPKQTGKVEIKVKAANRVSVTNQSLKVTLQYRYFDGIKNTSGMTEDKLVIPVRNQDNPSQPVVLVSRSSMSKPISGGETVSVTLTFKNAGKMKVTSPVAAITTSEDLILQNDNASFLLPDLEPGKTAEVKVTVKAVKEISSANQALNTSLTFGYEKNGTMMEGTASDRITIPANVPTIEMSSGGGFIVDSPVPNVIISDFTYGEGSVSAGSKFTLGFTFQNTGKKKIENIVTTVDGGESFTMDGSTNTFYYEGVSGGQSQTQQVPMVALSSSKSGAQSITISFKYEYVDGARKSTNADIKITVPVSQPDRFEISDPAVPEYVTVWEETAIPVAYVNKGKGEVSNVEVSIEGENLQTLAPKQYVGNVAPGTSGNFGVAFTPTESGKIQAVIKITYEDADQQLQVREYPVTFNAEEPVVLDTPDDMPEPAEPKGNGWVWIVAAIVVAAGAGTAVIVVRKRKNKTEDTSSQWTDWMEDDKFREE